MQVHFELFVRRNKASAWALELAAEDRQLVVDTGEEMLRDNRAVAVRVTKEILNRQTGAYDSFTVMKKGDDLVRGKDKPETPPPPLCTGPPDFYTVHAREQIGRVLEDWLRRRRVTPFELLHRPDLAEHLDAGMDLQHAIQKISIPEAQARGVSPHEVMRHYRKIADDAVARLAKANRAGFANLAEEGFAQVVERLRGHGDGAFLLAGAVAAHLRSGETWREKIDLLLTLAQAAPTHEQEKGRAFALAILVQPLSEILGSPAGLADFGSGDLDLGGRLALLTRLVACAEVDRMTKFDPSLAKEFPPLTPQIERLALWLQDPVFTPVRSAMAKLILTELNGPRRLRPSDAQGEIVILRALAMVLTAFAGRVLATDDVQDAFTQRSRNLVSPEFVCSYMGAGATALEEVQALIRLAENLVGDANKRAAAKWILGAVGALKFERDLRAGQTDAGTRLCALADLRRALDRIGLPQADHGLIAERLGVIGGLIDEDSRFVARIARSPAPATQRLARLVGLATGKTAPPGPAAARAQAEVDKLIRTPDVAARTPSSAA